MTLHLNVLGGLSLSRGDQPMAGAAAQRKPLALLAVIERAGARGISRERLQSLLAPESDEERARGVLKQLLYALRKDSGESTLVDGVSTLTLNADIVQCDLRRFEEHCASGAWQLAVDAYRGPFLEGIYVAGAPEFDEWADQHRRVAAGLYRRALLELAVQREGAERGSGEECWIRLSALDPLDPQIAVGLMRSLAARGNRPGALQVARDFEARTRSELGLDVDPSVQVARAEIEAAARTSPTSLPVVPETVAVASAASRPRWVQAASVAIIAIAGLAGAWRASSHPRPVRGVPYSEVANFTNQTGIDSLGFLGAVIGDRIALDLGARGIALSHRPNDTTALDRAPELAISGSYFTAGDTFFIQAEVKAQGTRYGLFEMPLVIGTVQSANTVIDSVVSRVSLGVAREFEAIRREWALDSTAGRDPSAMLWFALATRRSYGDFRCEERLAFLDSAYARDPSLIQALIYHAELNPVCRDDRGKYQAERLAGVRQKLAQQQEGQNPFTFAYINYLLQPDSATRLHAARSMLEAAPHSGLALGRLVRTLADYNQYPELIRVYEGFEAANPEPVADANHDPLPGSVFPYADALHLAGRYEDELHLYAPAMAENPTLAAGIRLRAQAALHQPFDMSDAINRLRGAYTANGNLLLQFVDELAAHGYKRVADSLAKVFPTRSCMMLEQNVWNSRALPAEKATEKYGGEPQSIQASQLESVERSLRFDCVDNLSHGLADVTPPIFDSLRYVAVRGELAASRGDHAGADSALAWLARWSAAVGDQKHVPWYVGYRRARIAAQLGRRDQAFQLLSAALESGMAVTMDLHTDPLWRTFASDPMFRAVIGR